ncbi:hypothetical protein E2320_009048 [Naja naja]|nr:hypothetical protein E2320_009048 [Naja naja]
MNRPNGIIDIRSAYSRRAAKENEREKQTRKKKGKDKS